MPDSMASLTDTIRAVWKERQGDAEKLRLVLKRKMTEVETRRSTLVDRWLDGKVDQRTYDENIGRLTAEIESIGWELRGTELEEIELDRVLDFAEKIILRPARLWWNPHLSRGSASRRPSSLMG